MFSFDARVRRAPRAAGAALRGRRQLLGPAVSESYALRSEARSATGAAEALGAGHPLARAEERVRWLGRQAATVAVLLPAGALLLLAGAPGWRLVLPAAAVAEGWLLLALVLALDARRARAVELIAQGRSALPIPSVQRKLARLPRRRYISRLAASVEALRLEARASYRACPRRRPLYVPTVIRQVDAELARIAELLRGEEPDPVTIARVEVLLGGESSPLYEHDPERLREELHRIEFLNRAC
jgi:hypothetical protein